MLCYIAHEVLSYCIIPYYIILPYLLLYYYVMSLLSSTVRNSASLDILCFILLSLVLYIILTQQGAVLGHLQGVRPLIVSWRLPCTQTYRHDPSIGFMVPLYTYQNIYRYIPYMHMYIYIYVYKDAPSWDCSNICTWPQSRGSLGP